MCISRLFSVFGISVGYFQHLTIILNAALSILEHTCIYEEKFNFQKLIKMEEQENYLQDSLPCGPFDTLYNSIGGVRVEF